MGKSAQRAVTGFDFAAQRRGMIEHHIAARGVRSESVLRAMSSVRREEFLPSNLREFAYSHADVDLLEALLDGCSSGLTSFVRAGRLAKAVSNPLAFRELGLAIGLKAVSAIAHAITERGSDFEHRSDLHRSINLLQRHVSIGDEIIDEWLPHAEQKDKTWLTHQDINEVMLTTALMPDTFLSIGRASSRSRPHRC